MKVNIVVPEDNWILPRIANELHKRLDYTVINGQNKDDYDINYYLNYYFFKEPSKGIDIAWFTHIEESNDGLTKKFFDVSVLLS